MFIQNCKISVPSKKLIPGTNILPHPLFPRPGYVRLPGQRYNYHRHCCDHHHHHHHDHRRLSRHLHNHHCICCHPHPHDRPNLNQITCGGWDTERRESGVRRRLPALSTLKKDDVYEHADDDDDVVGSDDNHDEDEWSWCWWTQSAGLIPIALTNNMAKLNEQGGNTHFLKHKNDAFSTQSFRKCEQWWLLRLQKKVFFFRAAKMIFSTLQLYIFVIFVIFPMHCKQRCFSRGQQRWFPQCCNSIKAQTKMFFSRRAKMISPGCLSSTQLAASHLRKSNWGGDKDNLLLRWDTSI